MMKQFLCAVAVGAFGASALANVSVPGAVLGEGSLSSPHGSIFRSGSFGPRNPLGDTYGAEPLLQDGASAFFLDNGAASVFNFDGASENGGASTAYQFGVDMIAVEAFTPSATGGLVQVEVAAVDALAGANVPWVPAGVLGPAGPFNSWRLDVGSTAATNPVDIALGAGQTINVLNSGFTAFNSAGASIGTFALTLDTSGPTQVSGLGVVGLGGADIAGFDMASIQLFWEYEVVPAPAGVMLLGFGGLALARRRR
jgi:hypothetical protein